MGFFSNRDQREDAHDDDEQTDPNAFARTGPNRLFTRRQRRRDATDVNRRNDQ